MNIDTLLAAFVLGLMGAGHCLGMCGGVVAALSFANKAAASSRRIGIMVAYNVGRILSYGSIGFLLGLVASGASAFTPLPILRMLSGLLLIAMGLYLTHWWKVLTRLEAFGALIWRYISPIAKSLMPVTRIRSALLLGMLWGWLPCGLVYSMLGFAASQGTGVASSMVMIAFGLGTLPAVVAGGVASGAIKRFIAHIWVRNIFGVVFVLYGFFTLLPVVAVLLSALGFDAGSALHDTHHH